MIFATKIFLRELILMLYAKVFGYYKRLDLIPIWNWMEVIKGNYKYLYKKPINRTPEMFRLVYMQLFYQYEKVNIKPFNDLLKLAVLRANEALTGDTRWTNQANEFEASLISDEEIELPNLTDMRKLIEITFNQIGSIDVHKMDAQTFLSYYDEATKKIEEKNRLERKRNNTRKR